MSLGKNPILYEINTPVYLDRLSKKYGRRVDLATIPDEEIDRLANLGVGVIWPMGIWARSIAGREISMQGEYFERDMRKALTDYTADDVLGSAYSILEYAIDPLYGGEAAYNVFRQKLKSRHIKIILDFVPNHVGLGHALADNPNNLIQGTAEDLLKHPDAFISYNGNVVARGRDPSFPPWSDVLQLNAFADSYRQSAINEIKNIARLCDGIRCDMAMLLINKHFARTWGKRAGKKPKIEFWEYVIGKVKIGVPNFVFAAETYWQTEKALLSQGFDFCYDHDIYELVTNGPYKSINKHIGRSRPHIGSLIRYIENHDEARAAEKLPTMQQQASTALIATLPGVMMLHDGQIEGFRTKLPVHLRRGPHETADAEMEIFYHKLLPLISEWRRGEWRPCKTNNSKVLAWQWNVEHRAHLAIINYSARLNRARVTLPTGKTDEVYVDELTNDKINVSNGKHPTLECELSSWQFRLLSVDK